MSRLTTLFNRTMYKQGVSMGRVVRRIIVTTDASLVGWEALLPGLLTAVGGVHSHSGT